ncbi:Anaphase-promoting complex subunit 8 [Mycena sanguinolenta]|uniref:Anaphase-promoting complex subunit 8 n=1 Tax=Mycena sanguinolenta TaxID=230812 RepID=A0A8H6ZBV7_9AGAR|nr:Anaphase-promoting complex subunit 8 [Mycena sanguinolenta]
MDRQMVEGLRASIKECSERGLNAASKWASELLLSVPFAKRHPPPLSAGASSSIDQSQQSLVPTQISDVSPPPTRHRHAPSLQTQPEDVRTLELEFETEEEDLLFSARTFIESRDPMRAIHVLHSCRSAKAQFLSLYCQFIATEKRALRSWHRLDNRHQPSHPINPTVEHLLTQVVNATDPWLLHLKALFLSRLKDRRDEAIESAILSIAGFPWNWATWTLLGSCIEDGEELSAILPLLPLPSTHPLVQMFQVKVMNELHIPSDNELGLCDQLLSYFPGSLWVMSLRACALYYSHEFKPAQAQFERILAIDPSRVEDIDIYSNILYVTDGRLKLSRLANEFLASDRDRPEVCALVGNLHSLRGEHGKSVQYFHRATQLDRTYLAAWTLMGHEYVEMKNSHAAIESYRRAVEVNRKDYRAWYGIGQAYELLNMHQYAMYYYHYATALRPYDVRLWQAQGMCYEEMGKLREAAECFKRALITADPHEITINLRLANLYNTMQDYPESVAYHRRVVEVCQANGRSIQDFAKSSVRVAEHHLQTNGDLILAREYLTAVAASNVEEVARAAELLKAVNLALHKRNTDEERKGQSVVPPAV